MIHILKNLFFFNVQNIKSSVIQIKSRYYSVFQTGPSLPSSALHLCHPTFWGWDKGTVTSVHRSLLIIQVVRETFKTLQ